MIKISTYITSWAGTVKSEITIEDVLTMRSGLYHQPDEAGLLGEMSLLYKSDELAVSLARDLTHRHLQINGIIAAWPTR